MPGDSCGGSRKRKKTHHLEVNTLLGNQTRVITPLNDLTVRHDEDDIGVLHRRKPVGDHDHRPATFGGVEHGLDAAFRLAVERARRLV